MNKIEILKERLINDSFDNAGSMSWWYKDILDEGYSILEVMDSLKEIGRDPKIEIMTFPGTRGKYDPEYLINYFKFKGWIEDDDSSNETHKVTLRNTSIGPLIVSLNTKSYQVNDKSTVTKLEDYSIENIKNFGKLNNLKKIALNNVDSYILQILALLKSLDQLQIGFKENEPYDLSPLKNIPALTSFYLENQLNPEDILHINAIPKLTNLTISIKNYPQKKQWPKLSSSYLEELTIYNTKGNFDDFEFPESIKKLALLGDVANTPILKLQKLKSLENLFVWGNSKTQIQPFFDSLKIQYLKVRATKQKDIQIPESSLLKEIELEWTPVESLEIKSKYLEKIKIDSPRPLQVLITDKIESIRSIDIKSKSLSDTEFLNNTPNIEDIKIISLDTFDFNVLQKLPRLRKLTLCDVKNVININSLFQHASIKELVIYLCKNVEIPSPDKSISLDLLYLDNIKQNVLNGFIKHVEAKRIWFWNVGEIDFTNFFKIESLEDIYIVYSKAKNIEALTNCANLTRLSISLYNEIDCSFLSELTRLKYVKVPAYTKQRELLIKDYMSRKECYLDFGYFIEKK